MSAVGGSYQKVSRALGFVTLFLSASLLTPNAAAGQGSSEFGVRGGYDFQVDSWTAGAQLRLPLLGSPFMLIPGGDLVFEDVGTGWQLTGDGAVEVGGVYFGGGYTLLHRAFILDDDLSTEGGTSLFVGLIGDRSRESARPGVEARWSFVDGETALRLMVSLNVPMGG